MSVGKGSWLYFMSKCPLKKPILAMWNIFPHPSAAVLCGLLWIEQFTMGQHFKSKIPTYLTDGVIFFLHEWISIGIILCIVTINFNYKPYILIRGKKDSRLKNGNTDYVNNSPSIIYLSICI